jgi:hypothetical protein
MANNPLERQVNFLICIIHQCSEGVSMRKNTNLKVPKGFTNYRMELADSGVQVFRGLRVPVSSIPASLRSAISITFTYSLMLPRNSLYLYDLYNRAIDYEIQ